jgi:hypothetical protein
MFLLCGCHGVKQPVSRLNVADEATAKQLLSGFWWVEGNSWRWTAGEFTVALAPPPGAESSGAILSLQLFIPDSQIDALGDMTLTASTEDLSLPSETFSKGGSHTYTRQLPKELMATSILPVKFCFDKAQPPLQADGRELGAVVTQVELRTQ